MVANGRTRDALTINRQIPGPTMAMCWNDEVIVDVENRMSGSALTIHWHGLHQTLTPWMDGVPMVTQCPILSGNTFRYRFKAEQPGTHFWHAHSGIQRTDGIMGRLVVRLPKADDPNGDLYDFDETQHSIILTDWTRMMAAEYQPGTIDNGPLKPDNVLINGLGCDTNRMSTNCDVVPVSAFHMQRGKKYRWRIVNAGSQNCPIECTVCITYSRFQWIFQCESYLFIYFLRFKDTN